MLQVSISGNSILSVPSNVHEARNCLQNLAERATRRYGRTVRPSPPGLRTASLALALVAGLVGPGTWAAFQERDGRDYATFYAATRVWAQGGAPYETEQLTALVRDDGVRRKPGYPIFYPPPALPLTALPPYPSHPPRAQFSIQPKFRPK